MRQVHHYPHFKHKENEAERRTRNLILVPQLIRGRSRIHKQPVILTITLPCLSKWNTERVPVDTEKLAEGVSQEDIQYLKPIVHVERVSQDEEENGVQAQDSVWAMREGMTARSLSECLLSHCGVSETGGRGLNLQAPQRWFPFYSQYP